MTAVKRTPRESTGPCPHCGGKGEVPEREHFSLWTPDEYEPAREYSAPGAPPDAYVCAVAPGANIFNACHEGVEIARLAGRPVAFVFNGMTAVCREGDVPEERVAAWRKDFDRAVARIGVRFST